MNYLRGALSAASQYYKDLPPINPSTLTGAIDVIVIERPTESGGTELVCSPFHVRFGKWQVLRPGEKKVNVLVNGHPIPFNMKIGDAGEAFFVFETDEDVPDELITSPLLQPTVVRQSDNRDETSTAGKFGMEEGSEGFMAPPEESELDIDGDRQEPEFLDLNATQSGGSSTPDYPQLITGKGSPTDPLHADMVAKPEGLTATRPNASENLMSPNHENNSLGTRGQDGLEFEADVGDNKLPRVDVLEAQPPKVTYHHDVVLDVSGYHSKGASERTIDADKWWERKHESRSATSLDITTRPDGSRSPSPESHRYPSALHVPRAISEPPEYGATSSPPPEYSWEWGAFPQRSPIRSNYSSEDTDVLDSIRFPPAMPDVVTQRHTPSPPRSRSPIPEADGGRLEADEEDPYRVWLDFEGQRLGFELSLCGDCMREEGAAVAAAGAAERFERNKVTYKQLMDDPDTVHSRDLVVRWDDEYIYQSDCSPLMPALVGWRRRTLSPRASPVSNAEAGPRKPIAAPRPSTWSRWWSRNRTIPDVTESSLDRPMTLSETGKTHVQQPSLDHPESAPANTNIPGLQQTTPLKAGIPFPSAQPDGADKKYAKTLRLTSDQLKALGLKKGANGITFSLSASGQVACTARIFLWDATDHVVVSDIDGTITKSDALGHVFTLIGRDWTHLGVAKLYTDICRNGYKIMYLTSRAIGQADSTRDYLKGIKQNNYQLPEGPVIMSPDRLLTSLHREVIMRKPETFKMACLRDIQRLFGTSSHHAFYAGFGNRITDALSYRSVNIPSARIFTIDSTGEVKMELLELAGYKSSYIHMTDIVDQMFPPINRKWAPEYTDFNYWRTPVVEYELPEALTAPPSPSLSASARSDTSTQTTLSRLRHFSLGRSSSRVTSPESSLSSSPARNSNGNGHHGGRIRTAASLDRLGSFLPVGEGIEYVTTGGTRSDVSKSDVDLIHNEFLGNEVRQGRLRNRPESMPGSLDHSVGMQDPRWFNDQEIKEGEFIDGADGDEEYDSDENEEEYVEEAAEEAFDDDLLATGEMETVPFL
ncbi:Lipin/Ned1/Smp2-domain-containing protein [Gautieria morchelliformis]|nr:Lipin/Ned1/Smp2-domain-containing protein [Gautieria morchelliformis]